MALTIDHAFVEEYRNLVLHLSQQKGSKLRKYVTEVSSNGDAYNFETLGATAMLTKSAARRAATQYVEDEWERRVATPSTYVHTLTIEQEDKVKMLVDPQGPYVQNQAMAVGRKYDELIIAAAVASALDGEGGTTALPAGQTVGDGASAIDFSLVSQVQEKFMSNDIDPAVPKVMAVGPKQVRALMNLTQATSADYVAREALQKLNATGLVPGWMGFDWAMISNLATLNAPDTGECGCLAFPKHAIGLAINQEMFSRIAEDPSNSFMINVFCQITAGAVRVEDEAVVQLRVLDT